MGQEPSDFIANIAFVIASAAIVVASLTIADHTDQIMVAPTTTKSSNSKFNSIVSFDCSDWPIISNSATPIANLAKPLVA